MTHYCGLSNSINAVLITVPLSLVAALSADINDVWSAQSQGQCYSSKQTDPQNGTGIFRAILMNSKGSICLQLQFSSGGKKGQDFQEAYQTRPSTQLPGSLAHSSGLLSPGPWSAETPSSLLCSETEGGGQRTGTRLTGRRD